MFKRDPEYYRRLLKQKQAYILKDLKTIEERSMILASADSPHGPSNSNHLPDLVSDSVERELAFLFASRNGTCLWDVEAALQRVEDGSFGVCLGCGTNIPNERLEVVPDAAMCVACQALEDRRGRGPGWDR